jgi:hypothetical protein
MGSNFDDPELKKPGSIDMLMGSDLFWNLLQDGRSGPSNSPDALSSTSVDW